MWTGGVRVIVLDEKNRMLMIKQEHPERTVWMVPGGGIEEGENAREAAIREVKEETGIDIEIKHMLWHIEEVGERGQRFVNIFMAKAINSDLVIGKDPERTESEQVIKEVMFMDKGEIAKLNVVYPELIKDEFWDMLDDESFKYDTFKIR